MNTQALEKLNSLEGRMQDVSAFFCAEIEHTPLLVRHAAFCGSRMQYLKRRYGTFEILHPAMRDDRVMKVNGRMVSISKRKRGGFAP